jgi:tRNA pseudouridine38-40 synthase
MPRYFLELAYKGTRYSGFQVQENAMTVQSEVEKALALYLRGEVGLTGSSRTDAGVHAEQNYFHFDWEGQVPERFLYNINAILPPDIVVRSLREVPGEAHCRFQASSREYSYLIYRRKDPFLDDRAWYFPFPLDLGLMQEAAAMLTGTRDFSAFSKRNTQVRTKNCTLYRSEWLERPFGWEYRVEGNRFLRGMVRGLVGTMVKVGRGRMGVEGFGEVLAGGDSAKADFSAPAKGLFLVRVGYPEGLLP